LKTVVSSLSLSLSLSPSLPPSLSRVCTCVSDCVAWVYLEVESLSSWLLTAFSLNGPGLCVIVVLLTRAVTPTLFPAIFHTYSLFLPTHFTRLTECPSKNPVYSSSSSTAPSRLWASSRLLGPNGPLSLPLLVLLLGRDPWSQFVDLMRR
jgi:hypothetical protein